MALTLWSLPSYPTISTMRVCIWLPSPPSLLRLCMLSVARAAMESDAIGVVMEWLSSCYISVILLFMCRCIVCWMLVTRRLEGIASIAVSDEHGTYQFGCTGAIDQFCDIVDMLCSNGETQIACIAFFARQGMQCLLRLVGDGPCRFLLFARGLGVILQQELAERRDEIVAVMNLAHQFLS